MMMMVQVVNKAMYNNNINKVLMESGQYFIFQNSFLHEIYTTHFMISTLIIWKDPLPVDCGKGPSQNMMMKKSSDIYMMI